MKWENIKKIISQGHTIWVHPADRIYVVHLAKKNNCFKPATFRSLLRMGCVGFISNIVRDGFNAPIMVDKYVARLSKIYLICA